MKGGTTSLFFYMASHPDIIPSSIKETNFFKTNYDVNKGVNWYSNLFKGNGRYAFEASPNYTKQQLFPDVPRRMHSCLPKVKLIYLVRDPIERMISHYMHNLSHGRESRSFSKVARDTDSNIIQTSKYFFQIQAFLKYYSDEQLLLIESEQLVKNTASVLKNVFRFLGIPPDYDATLLEKKFHESKNKMRKSSLERMLIRKIKNAYLLARIQKITKPFQKRIVRPLISSDDREIMLEILRPDIDKLRQFSGLKFSDWSL